MYCVLSFMYDCERICMCICDDRASLLIYVATIDSLHSPIVV